MLPLHDKALLPRPYDVLEEDVSELNRLQKSYNERMRELDEHLIGLAEWNSAMRMWKLQAKAYIQDLDYNKLQIATLIIKLDSTISTLGNRGAAWIKETQKEPMQEKTAPNQKTVQSLPTKRKRGRPPKHEARKLPPSVDEVMKKVETVGFEGIDEKYSLKIDSLNNIFRR